MNISNLEQLLRNEISQRWEEGYETDDVENKLTTILNEGVLNEQKLKSFWKEFDSLPRRSDFPYEEPSTLEAILKLGQKDQEASTYESLWMNTKTRYMEHGSEDV